MSFFQLVCSLLLVSISCAQDFGEIFNQSGVIVNLINDRQAKGYDQRKKLKVRLVLVAYINSFLQATLRAWTSRSGTSAENVSEVTSSRSTQTMASNTMTTATFCTRFAFHSRTSFTSRTYRVSSSSPHPSVVLTS